MSSITLHIPDSLLAQVRALTNADGDTVEQFALLAIAEKVSSLATLDYIQERAERAKLDRFDALLALIPNEEPPMYDRI